MGTGRKRIVVVGAGIAGLSCATHLRDRADVVVVDRGPGPAAESTAHGAGMVRRLGDDPVERTLAVRTRAWLDQRRPASLRTPGAVVALAHDPTAANEGVAALRALGIRVDPGSDAPVLAGSPVRTRWTVPDEALADPVDVVAGLAADLADRVDLRFGVDVRALAVASGAVVGVETEGGVVEADAVVLAAGAWSAGLAATAGVVRPLVALRRTLFRLEAPVPPGHPWVWIDDEGLYVRPESGGGGVGGAPPPGTWLACPCDEVPEVAAGAGSRRAPTAEARALLQSKLIRWLPVLADARVVDGWSGLRTFAPDRRPILGPDPALPGLWWVAGLGGYGLTAGWAAAEATASWLLGDPVPWLRPEVVAPDRRQLGRWPIRPTGEAHRSVLYPR